MHPQKKMDPWGVILGIAIVIFVMLLTIVAFGEDRYYDRAVTGSITMGVILGLWAISSGYQWYEWKRSVKTELIVVTRP